MAIRMLLAIGLWLLVVPVWADNPVRADDTVRLRELNGRVTRLYEQGKYAEAIPLAKEAIALAEETRGREQLETAESIDNLALLYDAQGQYTRAEPLYERSLAIRRRILGSQHPTTALSLSNLGGLYVSQGRYSDAEPLFKHALAISQKALGLAHPVVADNLSSLAILYEMQGRYWEAEPLFKRALTIRERELGPQHADTGNSLGNLAALYDSQGRYAEAESFYKRSLAVVEKAAGPNHPDTSTCLNNLAVLYRSEGRNAEAEPLLRRALAISESFYGPDHPDVATALNNLAAIFHSQHRFSDAEPLYRRALGITEEALGPRHPDTALGINNLALLYLDQGRYTEAEPLFKRALAIYRSILGEQHPNTGSALNNIAGLYEVQGRYTEAARFHNRALATRKGALGAGHPQTLESVSNLAYLYRRMAQWDRSANTFRTVCYADVGAGADGFPDCQAALLDSLWRSSASNEGAESKALRNEAIAAAQSAGADRTNAAFARGAAQLTAKRSGANQNAKRWEEIRDQMAALDVAFSAAAGGGGPEAAQVLANLNTQRDRLNGELAKTETDLKAKAPDFFDLIKPETVSVEDLQAYRGAKANILRADEVVILLVSGKESKDKAFERESLILAVSKTRVGWAALPRTVDILGQPQPLERVIASLQGAARSGLRMKKGEVNLIPFDLDISHALYKALFASSDEIRAVLEDPAIKTWVLAPQGMFISLPYSTLVMEQPSGDSRNPETLRKTKWLGIERTLTIVPSVSSLAIERLKLSPKSTRSDLGKERPEFLGFGDPDFARSNDSRRDCPEIGGDVRADTPALDTLFQGVNTNPKSVRELKRLPGTCREVKSMADAFKAPRDNVVLGLAASEAGVRTHPRISKARIIAFATHGLITGSLDNTLAQPALAFTPPAEVKDQLPPIEDDGLLTTTDAATLDLEADWVLLSACDTAAKEGTDPDGLSGLARAFFYAGARSLLVSHWKVDDEAGMRLTTKAVELMAEDPSLTRPQAFRLSMKALLDDTSDPRFAHPAFWAPFFIVSPE